MVLVVAVAFSDLLLFSLPFLYQPLILFIKKRIPFNFLSPLLITFRSFNDSMLPFKRLSSFVTIDKIVPWTPSSVSIVIISDNLLVFNDVFSSMWNMNINLLIS